MSNKTRKYKVTNDIPVPKNRASKYPFKDMKEGDSFEFDKDEYQKVATAASNYGKKHKKKFTVNSEQQRCWCIEVHS